MLLWVPRCPWRVLREGMAPSALGPREGSGAPFPRWQPHSAPVTHTFLVFLWEWQQDGGRSRGTLPGRALMLVYSWWKGNVWA